MLTNSSTELVLCTGSVRSGVQMARRPVLHGPIRAGDELQGSLAQVPKHVLIYFTSHFFLFSFESFFYWIFCLVTSGQIEQFFFFNVLVLYRLCVTSVLCLRAWINSNYSRLQRSPLCADRCGLFFNRTLCNWPETLSHSRQPFPARCQLAKTELMVNSLGPSF